MSRCDHGVSVGVGSGVLMRSCASCGHTEIDLRGAVVESRNGDFKLLRPDQIGTDQAWGA